MASNVEIAALIHKFLPKTHMGLSPQLHYEDKKKSQNHKVLLSSASGIQFVGTQYETSP